MCLLQVAGHRGTNEFTSCWPLTPSSMPLCVCSLPSASSSLPSSSQSTFVIVITGSPPVHAPLLPPQLIPFIQFLTSCLTAVHSFLPYRLISTLPPVLSGLPGRKPRQTLVEVRSVVWKRMIPTPCDFVPSAITFLEMLVWIRWIVILKLSAHVKQDTRMLLQAIKRPMLQSTRISN